MPHQRLIPPSLFISLPLFIWIQSQSQRHIIQAYSLVPDPCPLLVFERHDVGQLLGGDALLVVNVTAGVCTRIRVETYPIQKVYESKMYRNSKHIRLQDVSDSYNSNSKGVQILTHSGSPVLIPRNHHPSSQEKATEETAQPIHPTDINPNNSKNKPKYSNPPIPSFFPPYLMQ